MKILITDPLAEAGLKIIEKHDIEIIYLPIALEFEQYNAVNDIDGWIIRSGTKIDKKNIRLAKKLQVIGRAGVGVDNIDISEATRRGIVVMNTPDVNTISAAEHTIGLMLTISRNIHLGHLGLQNGEWNRHKLVGTELRNKTLGIIGLGKIGREDLKRCLGFGMKILGYDPFVNQKMFDKDETIITDLDFLVKNADYISIHVPLNKDTKNLFDYEKLSLMKTSSYIINVARGGIINEEDLTRILNENKIAGAAIDVFNTEPINFDNSLIQAKNILLSPHLGASTREAKEGVSIAICEQVCNYLVNDKLQNAINMPISNLSKLKELQPFLDLAELIGDMQNQLISSNSIKKVSIECKGAFEDIKPILLAYLKGLLKPYVPERINYINAESIATELGIEVSINYSNIDTNYNNLISINVLTPTINYRIDGSVFEDMRPRLVNVMGFNMEVLPKGTMLLIENIDVPGVIGKVGTILGVLKINIGAYLLNRGNNGKNAYSIIRIDNRLNEEGVNLVSDISEIISLRQVQVLELKK